MSKKTPHTLWGLPTTGDDVQKTVAGVPENAWLIVGPGDGTVKSTNDTSSRRVGSRQPEPLPAQYAAASACLYVEALAKRSHISPVTLSVTVPSPLSA